MPEKLDKKNISQRDAALIGILERMADQIRTQDALLKELIDRQNNIANGMTDSEFKQDLRRDEIDVALRNLQDSFARYRSDMITFVREQDIIRKSTDDTLDSIKKIAYALEETGNKVAKIEAGYNKHDKEVHDHIAYITQKWENLPKDFTNTNRNITELRVEMEQYFRRAATDSEENFEKYQRQTTKRLLALDGMMAALETLLIRTEPPEKKPPVPVRIIRSIRRFFQNTARSIRSIRNK